MNVFEDLIEELKEQNLLEETVIEVKKDKPDAESFQSVQPETPIIAEEELLLVEPPEKKRFEREVLGVNQFSAPPPSPQAKPLSAPKPPVAAPPKQFLRNEETYHTEKIKLQDGQVLFNEGQLSELSDLIAGRERERIVQPKPEEKKTILEQIKRPEIEKDHYRKRGMEEVSSLQMVDHVLSGVEREQMKIAPKPYDELSVKLALHDFMQVAQDSNSPEHAQAEFRLMQETESWYSALSHRDKHITVAHLRRFCETTRPVLSAQALISLARFYRNSPYSEPVRSKFDLIVTRLFSREIENNKRELLYSRDELITQLKELYANWASIQLYSVEDDDSEILIQTLKFEDFINESENAGSFEELVKNDFFNRLRMFKESCQENFFAPLITATAIESNISIGNRYIDLLEKEKENSNAASLEEKYGFLHDQVISDATGKTLQLVELLNGKPAEIESKPAEIVDISVKVPEKTQAEAPKKTRSRLFAVNKWLLVLTILTIVGCVGIYFWAEAQTQEIKVSPKVKTVNLENSSLKDYLQTARITDETFYGITLPSWETLSTEKKEETLRKILAIGGEKGFRKVHLISANGKAVGYASAEKVEIYSR